MIREPGVYRDFDTAAYFADPCIEPSLTQSIAKILIDQSPWHAMIAHPRLGVAREPEKYTPAKAIGNAAHKLMIGRGRDLAILPFNDFLSRSAKECRDEATKAGRLPVLEKHFDVAKAMQRVARVQLDDHEACDVLTTGSGEVMIAAEVSGFWFRALVDWLSADLRRVEDYKTTEASVAEHALPAKAERDGWHIQAAMQEWILDHIDPSNAGRRKSRFIAQEQYKPYALTVMELGEDWLTMGRKKLQYAMDLWAKSMTSGLWPGYAPQIVRPEFPGYAEARWLDREVRYAARERVERKPMPADLIMAG